MPLFPFFSNLHAIQPARRAIARHSFSKSNSTCFMAFLLVILATATMFSVVLAVLILATVRVLAKRRVCCVNNTMRAIFTRRALPEYAHLLKINHYSKNYYMPPCYSNKHAPRLRWLHILKIRILSGTAGRACRGSCAFGYTRRANIRRTCAPFPDALCLFWPLLLFFLPYYLNLYLYFDHAQTLNAAHVLHRFPPSQ